jgi:hypothetical protein
LSNIEIDGYETFSCPRPKFNNKAKRNNGGVAIYYRDYLKNCIELLNIDEKGRVPAHHGEPVLRQEFTEKQPKTPNPSKNLIEASSFLQDLFVRAGKKTKLFSQSNLILHSVKKPSIFTPFLNAASIA